MGLIYESPIDMTAVLNQHETIEHKWMETVEKFLTHHGFDPTTHTLFWVIDRPLTPDEGQWMPQKLIAVVPNDEMSEFIGNTVDSAMVADIMTKYPHVAAVNLPPDKGS